MGLASVHFEGGVGFPQAVEALEVIITDWEDPRAGYEVLESWILVILVSAVGVVGVVSIRARLPPDPGTKNCTKLTG